MSVVSIIALLAAGAALVFLASRRRNAVVAFVVGVVVAVVVAIALAIPFDTLASSMGGTEAALLGALVVLLVAAVGAGFLAMRIFVPAKSGSTPGQKPEAAPATGPKAATPQGKPSPPGPPPDVFISYKRDERAEVLAIARRLEALKLKVWFDADMRSGTTFDTEIDRHVRGAKAVLVCWSPGAIASDWVRGEATIGRQRNVLAAAILKACDLPAPFNLVHADDLTAGAKPSNPEWLRLVERIGMLTGRPGLAAFEALEAASDKSAYAAWIAANSSDPLFDLAVSRLKALPG